MPWSDFTDEGESPAKATHLPPSLEGCCESPNEIDNLTIILGSCCDRAFVCYYGVTKPKLSSAVRIGY